MSEVSREAADSMIVKLEKKMRDTTTTLVETRAELRRWREIRRALAKFDGENGSPAGRGHPNLQKELVDHIRAAGDVASADLNKRFGSSTSSTLTILVQRGVLVRPFPGVYRIAKPATVPVRPTPAIDGRPNLTRLEPLDRGAVPKARCPKCAGGMYHDAIGLEHGRYVFRCPVSDVTYFNPAGGTS